MQDLPNITMICCFAGRHNDVERVIRMFINQDYEGVHTLLLYNNSSYQELGGVWPLTNLGNKHVILINNGPSDKKTGQEYKNTGSIFRDAMEHIPENTDIVSFMDSDDIFLPNHVSEGVKGMKEAKILGCLAYKPELSYYLYAETYKLANNTHEPSIFVDAKYLKEEGFNLTTVTYHQKWINKLLKEEKIFIDPTGKPTLLYNWSEGHGNHKISGGSDNEANFLAHRQWETNHGDGILSPAHQGEIDYFYNLVKTNKN